MAARLCLNGKFAELLCRIRAEYVEMPGLPLTAPQARCLFSLDAETGDALQAARVAHSRSHSFGRPHQTLRVTPVMEVVIADHVWAIDALVASLWRT